MSSLNLGKVVIAGGSGFIGSHLERHFRNCGHEVVLLSRSAKADPNFRTVVWDGVNVSEWKTELDGAVAVINLCGVPVAERWTDEYKEKILRSRVDPSNAIAKAIDECAHPPSVWINAGGVGIYGDRGDEALSESSRPGEGFLADVSRSWEAACLNSESKTRKVVARFGVVLGREGGAFPIFLKLAKLFLGGPAGNGRQWMSWIHIEDLCRLLDWLIEEDRVSGAVNAVSPHPVRNGDFMDELRRAIGRPPVPGMPNAVFRQLVSVTGKEPSVLLESQRVFPVLAMSRGFEFQFPQLDATIESLIEPSRS